MVKSLCAIILAGLLTLGCKTGGGASGVPAERLFSALSDFSGAVIASEAGSMLAQFIDRVIPNVEHTFFTSLAETVGELIADRLDAIALSVPGALDLADSSDNLAVFPYIISADTGDAGVYCLECAAALVVKRSRMGWPF